MKKILLAFDGVHFSEGAFEFARQLNAQRPILLTGVFLPQVDYSNLWSYAGGAKGPRFIPMVEALDVDAIEKNIDRFQFLCRLNNIEYRVHKDYTDFALPELKKETRFADLLILGSESFYKNVGNQESYEYLRDVLHDSECPVLLVPEHFAFPEKNILAYDGSESAVYAIKQFAYLFPEFSKKHTLLVYAKEAHEKDLPDVLYIQELAARHFPDLSLFKLEVNPDKYFSSWASGKDGAILVCGSFGRSAFSQLFKKSFVTGVIRDRQIPVFITHR